MSMTCPTTCQNDDPLPKQCRRIGLFVIVIVLCVIALALLFVCCPDGTRSLNGWMSPKTFWRKDYDTVVKYHIRDYRVPWSRQLLAAIAFARKHGEQLYIEDTPTTSFARNRGNVNAVELSESERWLLRHVSDFLAEHCQPDSQHVDAAGKIRVFPTDEIAQQAKEMFEYAPGSVQLDWQQEFYVQYLLGVWFRELGCESASWHFEKALETADCVVMCPIMTLDERSGEVVPVAEACFPFGITTKHRTKQGDDFTLWYPAVTTDQHGLICLPVYREMIDELAFEAINADGTRFTVETFGVRDIARPYRFGLYVPVVLSGEQLSRLTFPPGFEEELRYVKRQVFTSISTNNTAALGDLGITFEATDLLFAVEGSVIMPTQRYANEFGELHFRGLTRTELSRQLRQYRNEHVDQSPSLTIADGDNFIVSRHDGRSFLCRFLMSNKSPQSGILDVWDLGWIP